MTIQATQVERTIRDIDFTMSMEDMPLTESDKQRLRDCITGKVDINDALSEVIEKHEGRLLTRSDTNDR